MKIKPIIDIKKISELTRHNPNTKGTHLLISEGKITEEKKDYSNIVLVSLMYERGFLKNTIKETVDCANEYVDSYENDNVMGL